MSDIVTTLTPKQTADADIAELTLTLVKADSGADYTLPTASASVKGGIKIGSRLTMAGATLSADTQQSLPTGGTASQVLEKIDGTDYNVQWATPSAGSTLPVGSIIRASQAPGAEWLACDGSVYTQAAKPLLYAQVGLLHDFASWTAVGINNSNTMSGVAYGNGRFVSVEVSSCKYSTDGGANWTRVVNAGTWRGIAYSPTLDMWICVGDAGIMDSSIDGGVTWGAVATPSFGVTDIWNICWDSTNLQFVAVGATGKVATSPDGATFTQQTSGTANLLYGVCHASGPGLIVAVGATGTLITSPTGVTWTTRTIPVASVNLYSVAYAVNINTIMCAGHSGRAAYSYNGTGWQPFYLSHANQIQSRIGTDGTRFLSGDQTSAEMTLVGADMVPHKVAQYTKFSGGGIAYGGGAWVIGGTDLAVHAAVAAYSYNSATSFRVPKVGLDAGIFSDSWIRGDP